METNNERAVRALERFWDVSIDNDDVTVLAAWGFFETEDTMLVKYQHIPPADVENGPSVDDIPEDPQFFVIDASGNVHDWFDAAL